MRTEFEDINYGKSISSLNQEIDWPHDSFELLSAYLDGELSPQEKHQVQTWIDEDPQVKELYTQLLTLQSQIQNLEVPPSYKTVTEISEQVFKSLERRRRHRKLILAGSAIAVSFLAGIIGLLPGNPPSSLKFAHSPNSEENLVDQKVMLAVALNEPAINIPKLVNGYSTQR